MPDTLTEATTPIVTRVPSMEIQEEPLPLTGETLCLAFEEIEPVLSRQPLRRFPRRRLRRLEDTGQ